MRLLTKEESDVFLNIHRHLILYTNQKYDIYKPFQTADDLKNISNKDIIDGINPIREKMYHKDIITAFCEENPFCFKENELKIALAWKNTLHAKCHIYRHLSDYTVFFSQELNRLYGVKSITSDLIELFPKQGLPYLVNAIILPFRGHLIYDGFLSTYSIIFGGNIRREMNQDYNYLKAMHGIYSQYQDGDDLTNPPETSSLKDRVTYSINQSIKRNEFPRRALELAETFNERAVFEHTYSKHYIKILKEDKKYYTELPQMHYAVYRDVVVAVMPTKNKLKEFCELHYPDITSFLTYVRV